MSRFALRALFGALLASAAAPAFAQELLLAQADPIIVRRAPPSQLDAVEELARVPGGVDLVPFEDYADRLAISFADTLRLSPGVIADPRFAEEVRLSIRGSGLSRGFHMRGLTLRLDGVPINLADGAGDFQEIDPLATQRIEVYRGANGLRFGAASLGGAVNAATPTGRDLDAPFAMRAEAGSFETRRLNLRFGGVSGPFDGFGALTQTNADGFREHLETQSTRASFNAGVRAGGGETRVTLNLNEINQHIPGVLTLTQALKTPEMAAPGNLAGDQARDIRSARAALLHRREIGGVDAEGGIWGFVKSLYHPIFQVVDQDSLDWGLFARVRDEDASSTLRRWTLGVNFTRGDNDAEQFVNVAGAEGARTYSAEQDAETIELYGEAELGMTDALSFVLGAQAVRSERFLRRTMPSTLNASRSFEAFNPKLGLLWRTGENVTWYANVSRSFEPPTFSEWLQAGMIQPVNAQSAWTGEIGVRGRSGPFEFDIAVYRAQVSDEMLQFSVDANHPAATFNADETIHQGIEAFADWTLLESERGALALAGAYTLSDFRFDGDAQYGDNDLAGAPRHQLHAHLAWRADDWFVAANLNWVPQDVTVDYVNTTRAPGYAVWGLSAAADIGPNARVFIDARNLADERYIATFSTAALATPAAALYHPGETRALYAGLTLRFGASP